MPKNRPLPGICVHCLNYSDLLTWDHVLPESWYPEGTDELEKWRVPACEHCNKELGKIEEDLLIKLGLCLDPNDLKSLGIPDKVLRSLSPEAGTNPRDSSYRVRKREKILRSIKVLKTLPQKGIFPNFGPLPNVKYKEYPAISIEEEEIRRFGEKITRGIAYVSNKSYIDKVYKIGVYPIEEQETSELKALIDSTGTIFDSRPGMLVQQALVEKNRVAGLYRIEIWERFRVYVTVVPENLEKNLFDPNTGS